MWYKESVTEFIHYEKSKKKSSFSLLHKEGIFNRGINDIQYHISFRYITMI